MCQHRLGEPHFWDEAAFLSTSPSSEDMKRYYSGWAHCRDEEALFEKSPNYFIQPWAPRRLCEVLGRPKLVHLLRNPIDRAYSAYYQGRKWGKQTRTPRDFDLVARMEVALVKKCPAGALRSEHASGAEINSKKGSSYRSCCKRIAKHFRQDPYKVCMCKPRTDRNYHCDPTSGSHSFFYLVRTGMYAHHLRLWFKYHRVRDMLILRSEDFFARMPEGLGEISCFLQPEDRTCLAEGLDSTKQNSATDGHRSMWKRTRRHLMDFYKTYNQELEALLGRKMSWW